MAGAEMMMGSSVSPAQKQRYIQAHRKDLEVLLAKSQQQEAILSY
jgi:hypothetical protein